MKLLVTADFHGSREAFEKAFGKARETQVDAIVICGDVTHFGSTRQAKEFFSILTPLGLPILWVSGNTDPPELATIEIEGASNIHAKCKTVCNHSFIGAGAPHPTFEVPEESIMHWLEEGANDCLEARHLIVVAHVPPNSTKVDVALIGGHVGSLSLRQFITKRRPVTAFCGHIHEGRGTDYIGNTVIVNPGSMRKGYYALAELNGKAVSVSLRKG